MGARVWWGVLKMNGKVGCYTYSQKQESGLINEGQAMEKLFVFKIICVIRID